MKDRANIDILLVEDNKADAELVCEILRERLGCSPDVVEDGEMAVAYLNKQGAFAQTPVPDLVLLDLNLPKVSGREVLRRVKQDENLRRIPILMFTSSDAERDVVECYNLHANCYIQKPTNLEMFDHLIDSLHAFWIGQVTLPPKEQRRENE
jgi:CheY-like chemotaxis protein